MSTAESTSVNEAWRWDATTVAARVGSGEVSCRDVTASVLDRIDMVNPRLNAVVDVMAAEALAAATAADEAARRGDDLGPLHGVPVTVKVNVDLAGRPTTGGVAANADHMATEDAPVVANLRRAGAVIVGRTNTPAFSLRWFTDNDVHGRTLNPWSDDITPGGSSGGAASALAAGIGAIAHGNDYGGSIRHPAWACGVVGLRPTVGRVPSYNASAVAERVISNQLMSVQGPLARTVHDAGTALRVMAAGDVRDPTWNAVPLDMKRRESTLRIGVFRDPGDDVADPSVVAAIDQAAGWLTEAGCSVEESVPPRYEEAVGLWASLVFDDLRRGGVPAIRATGDAAVQRTVELYLATVEELDRDGYLDALMRRLTVARDWSTFLDRFDVLLTATSWERQFPVDDDQRSAERTQEIIRAQGPLLSTAMLGLPGLAVPVGVHDGLPTGVHLIANRYREDLLLAAGTMIESRSGYDVLDCVPQ